MTEIEEEIEEDTEEEEITGTGIMTEETTEIAIEDADRTVEVVARVMTEEESTEEEVHQDQADYEESFIK